MSQELLPSLIILSIENINIKTNKNDNVIRKLKIIIIKIMKTNVTFYKWFSFNKMFMIVVKIVEIKIVVVNKKCYISQEYMINWPAFFKLKRFWVKRLYQVVISKEAKASPINIGSRIDTPTISWLWVSASLYFTWLASRAK